MLKHTKVWLWSKTVFEQVQERLVHKFGCVFPEGSEQEWMDKESFPEETD